MARSPWHVGETAIHATLGISERLEDLGQRMIRDHMPEEHRIFFAEIPFAVMSALDEKGDVWPFLVINEAGVFSSPAPDRLILKPAPFMGAPDDLRLQPGDKTSILGMALENRRRNRVNGTILERSSEGLLIQVDQSFGNCPKYIHTRAHHPQRNSGELTTPKRLNSEHLGIIRKAETLFIASRASDLSEAREDGVDVNHRGGLAGFVYIRDDGALIIPDYRGNRFFNTLGNILRDARAGLLIPDFEEGHLLTLTGQASVVLNDPKNSALYGASRYLIFFIEDIRFHTYALPFTYPVIEYSPYAASTERNREPP